MGKIVKRAASLLAVLALAFGVLIGFQLPANAVSCQSTTYRSHAVTAGSSGAAARSAQCLLRKVGYSLSVDGSFSSADAAKVKAFQRKHGISASGRVGPQTWSALVKTAKASKTTTTKKTTTKKAPVKKTTTVHASKKGLIALNFAKAQLGERYVFAGAGPNVWDCSGLTMMAWRKAGVRLPHNAHTQIRYGKRVSRSQLQLGDLVFFYPGIHHVGIYAGNGRVIHAPNPRKRVQYIPIKYMPYEGASRPG